MGLFELGCQPKIGDGCNLSNDCSIRGDRVCDTSQPGGYCTILGCLGNACPAGSTCVAIDPEVPGCAYDDRRSPSRSTRSLCMAVCNLDADCRFGYRCQDIRNSPWRARPLDDGPFRRVCVVGNVIDETQMMTNADSGEALVCKPGGPDVPPIVLPEAGADAGADASADAADAGDLEAGDASSD